MRHLLAILVALVLVTSSLAQSGGLVNGTRGVPQPNEGSTGTVLNNTAVINAAGQAIQAQITNTTVPVRIVIGGAGTTGNAVLASAGTLAPCVMDAAVASAGNFYVIESTTAAGQCHPQSATPAAGTYIIGYLHDPTTTATQTALVYVSGSIYGGTGGSGSGTVNTGTLGALAYYPAASAAVSPMVGAVTAVSATNGINLGTGILQFGNALTATDVGIARLGPAILVVGSGTANAEGGWLRTNSTCTMTADTAFGSVFCIKAMPATSRAWTVRCVVPWQFTSGSGTANVTFTLSYTAAPQFVTNFSVQLLGITTPAFNTVPINAASGGTTLLSQTGLTISTTQINTLYVDGVLAVAGGAGGTFSLSASTSAGAGTFKAGSYCVIQ